jgi:hypothetical protein
MNTASTYRYTKETRLLDILTEYEDLFDSARGEWNTEPVHLELKEGAKPFHGRAFPVPKIHKNTLIKELNRLCDLGVLEFQPESEWVSRAIIHKNTKERSNFKLCQ